MRGGLAAAVVTSMWLASGCQRGSTGPVDEARQEGERAVRTYLEKMVEAYRVSDAGIVDPYVGEEHGLRLLGLIGVKRDAGITLDAQVTELVFEGAERKGEDLFVTTRERWHYRDRKIGTGLQEGEESTDAYHLRYRFRREAGKLKLMEIEFIEPPQVGRAAPRMELDPRQAHGLPPREVDAAPPLPVPGGGGQAPGRQAPGTPPPGHPPIGPSPGSVGPDGATP